MSKNCPKCKNMICKLGLESNRVVCPSCKYGDFCYKCLMPWNGTSSGNCGNSDCKFLNDYLAVCPWNKAFKLADKQERWILTWLLNIEPVSIVWQHSSTKKHANIWSVHFVVPIFAGFVCTSIRPITGDSVECSINIVEKWHPFNNCDHHLLIILSWLHNIWNKNLERGI